MTGFATVETSLPDGRALSVTLKSVNHRHLDLGLRLPSGLDALEPMLRHVIKERVRRGHVELTLSLGRGATGKVRVDEELLAEYVAAFRRSASFIEVTQEVDLNAMLRMPGVMGVAVAGPEDVTALEVPVRVAVDECLNRFEVARKAEGASLAKALRASMGLVAELAEEAAGLRAGVAAAEFARLKARMAELLEGTLVSEDRLLTEAALLAGRGDIEEELVRLRTHVARFLEVLDAGGEVGRGLDFLLQEMNREANTALSKTGASAGEAGLRLTEIGLAVKGELERAREQVQNLE